MTKTNSNHVCLLQRLLLRTKHLFNISLKFITVLITFFFLSLIKYFRAAIILRVQGDDTIRPSAMNNNHSVQVPRLKMTRVHIPFTFRLLETGNNSCDGKYDKLKYS